MNARMAAPQVRQPESRTGPLQTKLAVGSVDDPLEYEADRIANQVMASPSAGDSMSLRVQRASDNQGSVQSAPSSVERALSGTGRLLPSAVREDMERRF